MIGAIIVAAGESRRMGGVDKVLIKLADREILLRAVEPFQQCPIIDRIVVVTSEKNQPACRSLLDASKWGKVIGTCVGGERRQDSVRAGLGRLTGCDWVVVHDAARPLVSIDLILRGIEAAMETGAAIAAVPITDTIKVAGETGFVSETPDRTRLWAAQTPQVFRFDIIDRAYHLEEEATDDASLVERLGYKVKLYMGSYRNIKITTPDDVACAEAILRQQGG